MDIQVGDCFKKLFTSYTFKDGFPELNILNRQSGNQITLLPIFNTLLPTFNGKNVWEYVVPCPLYRFGWLPTRFFSSGRLLLDSGRNTR